MMTLVNKLRRALVTVCLYHHVLHWGLWVFLSGLLAHLPTRWWDERRRIPQHCAVLFWGKLQFWSNPFWRIRVEGRENIGDGPYLVCCNHQSLVDSMAMLMIGHQVKFISHAKVFKAGLLGPYMRLCGYVSVDPRNPFPAPDVARNIKRWWDLGESICLYPEGTRSLDGEVQPFKVGGFRLARNHGVPILPVAIDGTHGILPKGAATFRNGLFHPIRVRILSPIHPDTFEGDPIALSKHTHDVIEASLDELRGRPPRAVSESPGSDPAAASA